MIKIAEKRKVLKALGEALDVKGAYKALKGTKGVMGVGKKPDRRLAALLTVLGISGASAGATAALKPTKKAASQVIPEDYLEKLAAELLKRKVKKASQTTSADDLEKIANVLSALRGAAGKAKGAVGKAGGAVSGAARKAFDFKGALNALKGSAEVPGSDKRLAALMAILAAGGAGAGITAAAKSASQQTVNEDELEKIANVLSALRGAAGKAKGAAGKAGGAVSGAARKAFDFKGALNALKGSAEVPGSDKRLAALMAILAAGGAGAGITAAAKSASQKKLSEDKLEKIATLLKKKASASYRAGKEAALRHLAEELVIEKIAASYNLEPDQVKALAEVASAL
jgi:hypothetical protein